LDVVRLAERNEMALVNSVDFFRAFCLVLTNEIPGEVLLDRITDADAGIVDLADLI
jgi:hypothetical protein